MSSLPAYRTHTKREKTSLSAHASGIGGQAVIEGIMMKNKDMYSVAVRTESGDINVNVEEYDSVAPTPVLNKIPFIRGIFNFVDSLILGTRVLNYSASFYEDEGEKKSGRETSEAAGKFVSVITVIISLAIAIGLFMLLPYFLSQFVRRWLVNETVIAVIEGLIRIIIFLLYLVAISSLKDIRRVFMYHGAEHKCINCLEHGLPLTIENVEKSSRQHKRCGTSFLFFVVFVSVVLFVFIKTSDPIMRIVLRVLLIPVIAGISYEIIRLAGRSDNILINILSSPGMMLQKLTTREPDAEMIEVAIVAVDAIFDWKGFLLDEFGYDVNAGFSYENAGFEEPEYEQPVYDEQPGYDDSAPYGYEQPQASQPGALQGGYDMNAPYGYGQAGYEQPVYGQPGYDVNAPYGYEGAGYGQAGYEQLGYEQSGYDRHEVDQSEYGNQ